MRWQTILGLCVCSFLACAEAKVAAWPNVSFSPKAWEEAPPEQRYVFYKSLVRSEVLDGKTKGEVVALLGEPSSHSPGGLIYHIGMVDGTWSFSSLYLLEVLLEENRVSGLRIRYD